MGSPGIHHARTAARGSAHIRKMHSDITMDPGPLSHTSPHAHDARPLDLTLRMVRFPALPTPHTQTTLVCRIDAGNQRRLKIKHKINNWMTTKLHYHDALYGGKV